MSANDSMKLAELQAMCTARGLAKSGTKAALIARLNQAPNLESKQENAVQTPKIDLPKEEQEYLKDNYRGDTSDYLAVRTKILSKISLANLKKIAEDAKVADLPKKKAEIVEKLKMHPIWLYVMDPKMDVEKYSQAVDPKKFTELLTKVNYKDWKKAYDAKIEKKNELTEELNKLINANVDLKAALEKLGGVEVAITGTVMVTLNEVAGKITYE